MGRSGRPRRAYGLHPRHNRFHGRTSGLITQHVYLTKARVVDWEFTLTFFIIDIWKFLCFFLFFSFYHPFRLSDLPRLWAGVIRLPWERRGSSSGEWGNPIFPELWELPGKKRNSMGIWWLERLKKRKVTKEIKIDKIWTGKKGKEACPKPMLFTQERKSAYI